MSTLPEMVFTSSQKKKKKKKEDLKHSHTHLLSLKWRGESTCRTRVFDCIKAFTALHCVVCGKNVFLHPYRCSTVAVDKGTQQHYKQPFWK